MTTDYLLHAELEKVLGCLMPVNQLVCMTMLHTGLRIGDVLRLRKTQLARQFWVTEQKTGKRKRVNLPDALLCALSETAGEWVFPGRDPKRPLTRQAVWKDVKRAAKAYRLTQNAGTHSMRKVYAVELMQKYGDIERVQRALNHTNLYVTLLYAMADKRLERAKRLKKRKRS